MWSTFLNLQSNPQQVDQIGEPQTLSLVVVNRGPSVASNTQFDILIPTRDNGGDNYYIYLFNASISPQSLGGTCVGPFNPDRLLGPEGSRRKRR